MRYLFVFRLYSGLRSSLLSGAWHPFGLPDVYRLIEGLDASNIPATVVFLAREEDPVDHVVEETRVRFPNIDIDFRIVPVFRLRYLERTAFLPEGLKARLLRVYNDLRQFTLVVRRHLLCAPRPDLVYVDRRSIVFGAISALTGTPTLVRFHGVNEWNDLRSRVAFFLRRPLVWFALRAPFRLALSSEDGSPAIQFFHRYLSPRVPYCVALNGADRPKTVGHRDLRDRYKFDDPNWPIVLFVGRLTEDKGIDEFMSAIRQINRREPRFYLLFICGGSDPSSFERKLRGEGFDGRAVFERSMPHEEMMNVYLGADIYVSTNRIANMTNTVLEALACGLSVIVLGRNEKTGADESTEVVLGDPAVVRIPRGKLVERLTEELIRLVRDANHLAAKKKACADLFERLSWSWNDRISFELDIMKRIAKGDEWKPETLPHQVTAHRPTLDRAE